MDRFLLGVGRPTARLCLLVLLTAQCGCSLAQPRARGDKFDPGTQDSATAGKEIPPHEAVAKADIEKSPPLHEKFAATATATDAPLEWASPVWFQAVAEPGSLEPPSPRWRNIGLEAALDLPPSEQPNWRAELASEEPAARLSAAVALARRGVPAGITQLSAAARDSKLKLAARRAAVEALGQLAAAALPTLTELLEQSGKFTGPARSRYVPEVHVELLQVWPQVAAADQTQPLAAALVSPDPAVRRTAVAGYAKLKAALPTAAVDLLVDPEPTVRAAVLRALAELRDPRALDALRNALQDGNLAVRLAAIDGLGCCGDPAATALLEPFRTDRGELLRLAALNALVKLGDERAVQAALADSSWRVRAAIADWLKSAQRGDVAQVLLTDRSWEVRKRVVMALESWPLPAALPLLFPAAECEYPAIRQAAARQLRDRWPAAAELSVIAPPERVREQIASLRARYAQEFAARAEFPPQDQLAAAAQNRLQPGIEPLPHAEHHAANTTNIEERSGDPIETLTCEARCWLTCSVRLKSAAAWERRAALLEFARETQRALFSPELLAALTKYLERELDSTVWLAAFELLADRVDPQIARLIASAAGHNSAEIRKRSLDWFAAHPYQQFAELLLNTLDDDHAAVVIAALRAIAALRQLPDSHPVEELLAARDPAIRLAAAYALAAHGVSPGLPELLRLALHEEPQIRRQCAICLGELGDIRGLVTLVKLLDDRPEVQLAAIGSLKIVTGYDAAVDPQLRRDAGLAQPVNESFADAPTTAHGMSCHEQAKCWKCWHARQKRK